MSDVWKVFHDQGWDSLWYAHPGARYQMLGDRWFAGVWTGPEHDLICLKVCKTNKEADQWLSPASRTPEDAVRYAALKLEALLVGRFACHRCGFVGSWAGAPWTWCPHCS